jgi:hypothetical protein
LLEVLVHLPQFVCVLFESAVKFDVDFLNSPLFLLFLELLHALSHALTCLFWCLLHLHNLIFVSSIFLCEKLS